MFIKEIKLLFVVVFFSLDSVAQITFQKLYETSLSRYSQITKSFYNSGYFICGNEIDTSSPSLYKNISLLKTDNLGVPQWHKLYGTADDEYVSDMCLTSDNGIVFAGYFELAGVGGMEDSYVIKTDTSGNLIWSVAIGGNGSDVANTLVETPDGGYVIAGNSYSFGINSEIYLIKLDPSGNKIWSRVMGNGSGNTVASIKNTLDGGLILVGQVSSPSNIQIIKLDSLGIPEWDKNYHGQIEDWGYDIVQTLDSGYIVLAKTRDGDDETVFKIDTRGNPVWAKILEYNATSISATEMLLAHDNNVIISGVVYDSLFNSDIYLLKMDTAGNILWTNTYGGPLSEDVASFDQLLDSTFIILGTGSGFSSNDSYFIKTGLDGNSICNRSEIIITPSVITISTDSGLTSFNPVDSIWFPNTLVLNDTIIETILCLYDNVDEESKNRNEPLIYPNPASSAFNVHFDSDMFAKRSIKIINSIGEIIYSRDTIESDLLISLINQPPGIYYCIITIEDQTCFTKTLVFTNE